MSRLIFINGDTFLCSLSRASKSILNSVFNISNISSTSYGLSLLTSIRLNFYSGLFFVKISIKLVGRHMILTPDLQNFFGFIKLVLCVALSINIRYYKRQPIYDDHISSLLDISHIVFRVSSLVSCVASAPVSKYFFNFKLDGLLQPNSPSGPRANPQ